MARQDLERLGKAGLGRHGPAWPGVERRGEARMGWERRGQAWLGESGHALVTRRGEAGMARRGKA